ncbi:MAG: acyltransferase [Actinobacteria bacterium]|nr:acyltransferase [Actinomycetota bacterium]
MRVEIKRLIPAPIKQQARRWHSLFMSRLGQPRMIWGYQDASGQFRPRTRISNTAYFYHPERISIADNVFIWHYTILDGTGGLTIGEGTQIGAWVGIFTHSSHIAIRLYGDHYQEVPEAQKKGYLIAPIRIGRYVFIGAGSKILPGVDIGDGVLISADSVVKNNIDDFAIVAGNPAKVIGDTRNLDTKHLDDPQIRQWYDEWQM